MIRNKTQGVIVYAEARKLKIPDDSYGNQNAAAIRRTDGMSLRTKGESRGTARAQARLEKHVRPVGFFFLSVAAAATVALPSDRCGAPTERAAAPAPTPAAEAVAPPPAPAPTSMPQDLFASSVRPVLLAHCAPCHEPGGKMYAKLPFDEPSVVASHSAGVLRRLQGENREAVEQWFATLPPGQAAR